MMRRERSDITLASVTSASVFLALGSAAFAQEAAPRPTINGGAGIRAGNIASTGKTMPTPGASHGAGTTGLDRGIRVRDNQITGTICKGC